jgi:hypothetical protein
MVSHQPSPMYCAHACVCGGGEGTGGGGKKGGRERMAAVAGALVIEMT